MKDLSKSPIKPKNSCRPETQEEENVESNWPIGANVVLEGLTNKTRLKQWSHSYKSVAGAEDERRKAFLQRVRACRADGRPRGPSCDDHVGAACVCQSAREQKDRNRCSLHDRQQAVVRRVGGMERLVQRDDPTPAQAILHIMSRILERPGAGSRELRP